MRKKIFFFIIVIFVIVFSRVIFLGIQYFPVLLQVLFNHDISLKKTDDHVNVLLLGTGGAAHDGPNLTDTIIFVSIDSVQNKVTFVSIPRDLWTPDLNAKINTAYAFGEIKQKGSGLILAKAAVSKIVNQPINYGVRVDFDGFVKAVNLISGIDVSVDNAFDDYEYPITGKEEDTCGHTQEEVQELATASSQLEAFPCRYKHVHFDKGLQHMDGETALEFVRSRHAQGNEGSDFARSHRQEQVIVAFKNKIFSVQTIFDPTKVLELYGIVQNSIHTDIKRDEFDDFIRLAQKMKSAKITNFVIDTGDEKTKRLGLLSHPDTDSLYDNQWVLIPRIGNGQFVEIQNYVSCEITKGNCDIQPMRHL